MTVQQTNPALPTPPAAEPEPLTVTAPVDSRLAQLQAVYAEKKAAKDAAEKELKAITDAIKVELTSLDPEERRFELTGNGDAPSLRLTYVESWRLDSTRMKRENPETYVRYAKKSGSWTLKAGA